jgi:hypothetical protein
MKEKSTCAIHGTADMGDAIYGATNIGSNHK